MTIMPTYLVNSLDNTASIDIYAAAVLVTTYSYATNQVTLSALVSPTTTTMSQLTANITGTQIWTGMVSNLLSPTTTALSPFLQKITKDNNLKGVYEIDSVQITSVVFHPNTKTFTFQPRPVTTMPYSDFLAWVAFLDAVLKNARIF